MWMESMPTAGVRWSDLTLGTATGLLVVAGYLSAIPYVWRDEGSIRRDHEPQVAVAVTPVAVGTGAAGGPAFESRRPHAPRSAPPRPGHESVPIHRASQNDPPARKETRREVDAPREEDGVSKDAAWLKDLPAPDDALARSLPGVLDGDLPAAGPVGRPDSEGDGEADATDAITLYRAALRRFIAARYRVRGSGLSAEELTDKRVHLTLRIDEARSIIGAAAEPTGDPAFDRAATAALASLRGSVLPAPSPEFPGPLQSLLRVTFICNPEACD